MTVSKTAVAREVESALSWPVVVAVGVGVAVAVGVGVKAEARAMVTGCLARKV